MTTQQRRRFSRADLQREIARELETDPDISIRQVTQRLRARGVRARDERIRAGVRTQRTGARSPIELPADAFASPRQLGIAIRELSGDTAEVTGGETDPTHVALTYDGIVRVRVLFYGNPMDNVRDTYVARGQFVQPLDAYNPELLAQRIAQNIAGQVAVEVGNGTEGGTDGIEVIILHSDVRITRVEFRSTARAPRRRGR